MKLVFESELRGFDESAEVVKVFEYESPEEHDEILDMSDAELQDLFGVCDSTTVTPGCFYYRYLFKRGNGFLILTEVKALDV